MCPKHVNASKMMVDFATATAVCDYNVGYVESSLFQPLGIKPTVSVKKYLEQKNVSMDSPYKRKTRNKNMRRDLEYAAGGF